MMKEIVSLQQQLSDTREEAERNINQLNRALRESSTKEEQSNTEISQVCSHNIILRYSHI